MTRALSDTMKKIIALTLLLAPVAAFAQTPRMPGDPSATAYQGGVGSPFSDRASNINGADTNSQIAPRLPNPEATGDDTRSLLMAADRALAHHQTGAAQEALERAETRVLTRSTGPALASRPDTQLTVQGIADARQALGNRDSARARAVLEHILNPR